MKFRKEHTIDFMIERARNEADGYFELTYEGAREANFADAINVTVLRHTSRAQVIWRRGRVQITRSAAAIQLQAWREKKVAS